jgi:hypothetical protein
MVFARPAGWRQYLTTLQLLQFVAISLQSYLAYSSGAECGAPDWAKLAMMLYMGSMLVLFGNFFLQRYIFNKSEADMCGVIKAVEPPERIQYNGMSTLNSKGEATVPLPAWFNPKRHRQRGDRFSYQLTREISRAQPSALSSAFACCLFVKLLRLAWLVSLNFAAMLRVPLHCSGWCIDVGPSR